MAKIKVGKAKPAAGRSKASKSAEADAQVAYIAAAGLASLSRLTARRFAWQHARPCSRCRLMN
jgi:hypothetical protein